MARIGRVVAGGFPHHITQRGNRRQKTFFCNEDYELYIKVIYGKGGLPPILWMRTIYW